MVVVVVDVVVRGVVVVVDVGVVFMLVVVDVRGRVGVDRIVELVVVDGVAA